MLRVATVFSGIGAVEYALRKMNLEHKIVFACDNGEVELFNRKLKEDKEPLVEELSTIEGMLHGMNWNVSDIDYEKQFNRMYNELKDLLSTATDRNSLHECALRLNQLYEKLSYVQVQEDLSKLNTYSEKKAYVDNLYADKEKSNFVKKSYLANYDLNAEHFHWDVCLLDGKQYTNQVDLFVGGSPCQSFSMAGKRRGLSDTRGTLFYEYARLVKEIRPKAFIYENVANVLTHDKGNTWKTMQAVFEELGYSYKFAKLDAKDYGIPQSRGRLFVVGIRKDLPHTDFEFPKPEPLTITLQNLLLENLPEGCFRTGKTANSKYKQNFDKYYISDQLKKYVLSEGTKGFQVEPIIDRKIAKTVVKTYYKRHRAGMDNYVTTNGRLRALTPRETLRLMGFGDDFEQVVSDTQMYKQAGNSIVVDVMERILGNLIPLLGEEQVLFLKQDS